MAASSGSSNTDPQETRSSLQQTLRPEDRTGWYANATYPRSAKNSLCSAASWYSRRRGAGDGFCTAGNTRFMSFPMPKFEEMLVNSGIKLLKYYLDIGKKSRPAGSVNAAVTRSNSGNQVRSTPWR